MRAKAFLLAAAVILLIPFAGNAATLVETFDAGISLQNWSVHRIDAAGSPWTVQAPDDRGGLRIAKAADSDAAMGASDVYGLIESRFVLHGDLSVQIDFDLLTFPLADAGGWNEAVVRLIGGDLDRLRLATVRRHRRPVRRGLLQPRLALRDGRGGGFNLDRPASGDPIGRDDVGVDRPRWRSGTARVADVVNVP